MNLKALSRIYPLQIIKRWSVMLTFLLTAAIFLLFHSHILFLARYAFLVMGAGLGYCFAVKKRSLRKAVVLAGGLVVSWIYCKLYQEGGANYSPIDLLYSVCYLGIAVVLVTDVQYMKRFALVSTCGVTGFILLKLLRGANIDSIIINNSQNYVSVLILFFLLLYYLAAYQSDERYFLTPAFLFFIACVLVQGRGGIIISAFLFVALSLFKLNSVKNANVRQLLKFMIVVVILAAGVSIFLTFQTQFRELAKTYLTRFYEKGAVDTDRMEIWKSYFRNNCESVAQFFWSSDTARIRDDRNLHNSYLLCYASYGLIMMIVILVLMARAFFIGFRRKEYFMLILYSTLAIRAFTDRVFFQGYCEIFLYYFILYFNRPAQLNLRSLVHDANKNKFLLRLYDAISNHNVHL